MNDAVVYSAGLASATPRPSLLLHLGIGAGQGVVLWMLYEAVQQSAWPASAPAAFGGLVYATITAPVAWYLTHGLFGTEVRRAAVALLLAMLFGVLGAHAGATLNSARLASWSPGHVIAAGVLGFVLISLAGAWDARSRRFDYACLFGLAWRNAVLLLVAGALTAATGAVLVAGAWLMETIGITGLLDLYRKPQFSIPLTGAVFGLSFGLALGRVHLVVAIRQLVLSLAMWFLPLAFLFVVPWTAALPFTGVEPLFRTGNAAFYLLWFATLAIVFVNAAYQDGKVSAPYPRWLAVAMASAWLTMPLLTLLAGWALWQRVAQHGWTIDRIWAFVVWAVVTVHATGYAAWVFRRGRWMHTVPATNIAGALLQVVTIAALISPIADVQRLAATSQMARLRSGAVDPAAFDWNLLLHHTGSYGLAALREIAASPGPDDRSKLVAKHASDALRGHIPGSVRQLQNRDIALTVLRERVAVRPNGVTVDAALLEWLARRDAAREERNCVAKPDFCALWIVDVNQDGRPEGILLWEARGAVQGVLYSETSEGWRRQASLHGPPHNLAWWLAEIDGGRAVTVPPAWPDLVISGQRFRLGH